MNAPDFIRVGGILYRARTPQTVEAALPHVQSNASNALAALLRVLHDANVGEESIPQLVALSEALRDKNYPIAARIWSSIQDGIFPIMDKLEGGARNMFGRAAGDLDEALDNLMKTVKTEEPTTAAAPRPDYITVGEHLYRLRQ